MAATGGYAVEVAVATLEQTCGRRAIAAFAGTEVVQRGDCAAGCKPKHRTASVAIASGAGAAGGGCAVEIAIAGEYEAAGRFAVRLGETGKIMKCLRCGDFENAAEAISSAQKRSSV